MDENKEDILKNGVPVVILNSWEEFHQNVRNLKSKRGYVWRGQKKDEDNDWHLLSTFDRKVQTNGQQDRTEKLKLHLDNFKEEMNKSYPNVLPQDDYEIWALGQHYGLETPLLDWTLSPYIAAYFAFYKGIDADERNDQYRYVYALNRSIKLLISKRKEEGEILSSDRSVLFIDKLPYPNPRFIAQKGIFTKSFEGDDIWKYVQKYYRKRPSEVTLVKFKIPTKDREKFLFDLHLMNINHISLQLDLGDVTYRCNKELLKSHDASI